mmetsp:Transcript_11519/g.20833  ORF Transcript_11519/g.20833 Transcript_11519/m.20833 type:complete len:276 (-) Transcript_11519:666-1493(-)|eukprot:CAMPEP_0182442896 /NCGR_PEP_ID=MMETSP1172-20130603/1751_1 /TAXON_ID=708627 /ORGANISM="Timspurckia oligopyrenoides, Strain CCMP3278" /LENGTH=275 /DNA_ID=CAMNT_0024637969 /DNA_START=64 /DNA_END=891 /DNA_ORIENTATION=-
MFEIPVKRAGKPASVNAKRSKEELPRSTELEKLVDKAINIRALLSRLVIDLKSLRRLQEPASSTRKSSPFARSDRALQVVKNAADKFLQLVNPEMTEPGYWGALSRAEIEEGISALDAGITLRVQTLQEDAQLDLVVREARSGIEMCDSAVAAYKEWQKARQELQALNNERKEEEPKGPEEEGKARDRYTVVKDKMQYAENELKKNVMDVEALQCEIAVKCATEYVRSMKISCDAISAQFSDELLEKLELHSESVLQREQQRLRNAWTPVGTGNE